MEIFNTNRWYGTGLHQLHRFALYLVITALAVGLLVQPALAQEGARIRLQQIYQMEIGRYARPDVTRYLAHTGLGYGYEWCAAFISYCFGQAGRNTPNTPWSPSLLPGERLVWRYADHRAQPTKLLPGMIWGIYIPSKGRVGHVGFVDAYHSGMVTTVEGNTSDPSGRHPNGVHRKRRSWRTLHSIADWLSYTDMKPVIHPINSLHTILS
jgi:hypothetical protein